MGDQGRRIGGDQAFAFSNADDQRATFSRGNNNSGLIRGHHRNAIGAFDLPECARHGLTQVALIKFAD